MPSSYSTSFSLEKIATGEQSGTWGTTSNHNWDIVDRLTAYAAVALSGTTHTLTVREASPESGTENLQDGMYRVIKFTGALGAANTVTIAPNTTKAFFIIHNATTDSGSGGPYSVILSQGSGANVTVANGKNAIVYCDGAGAGAAVVDAAANLALATLTASGDITASGTVNVAGDTAASDAAAIGYAAAEGLILTGQGSTNDITLKNDADAEVCGVPTGTDDLRFPDDAKAEWGTGGDLQIWHAGDHSHIWDSGTGNFYIKTNGTSISLQDTTGKQMGVFTKDGAVTLYHNNSAKIATTSAGATVTGNLSISEGGAVNISTPLLASTDHTATGLSAQMLAGGAIAAFETVCIHTVTGEVVITDASAFATARCIGIAPSAISDTATGEVLLQGFIRDDTWNWTIGGTMYLSETAGDMTQTAPSTDGAFVQVLGIALTADVVYFNPSLDVIEHA